MDRPLDCPVTSSPGEFDFAGDWGGCSSARVSPCYPSLSRHPPLLLSQFESASPATTKTASTALALVRASIHKEAFFCGISPLDPTWTRIRGRRYGENKYVNIWSLISGAVMSVQQTGVGALITSTFQITLSATIS